MATQSQSAAAFYRQLGRMYGLYTGGFLAFIVFVGILELLKVPNVYLGYLFVFFTLLVYAVIGVATRTAQVSEYYVAGRRVPAFYNGMGPILAHERARESAWKPGTDPVLGRHEGTLLEPKQGVAYRGFQFVNLKPVRVGDTIHAHVRVGAKLELGPEKRAVIRRDVRVFNQRGELVQEGWHEMDSPRKPG